MNTLFKKMDNNFLDLASDYVFAFISIVGTYIGLDSIPEGQTLIQIVTSSGSESAVDVTQKIMTILSLLISSIAGLIPIIKTVKRNKK